MKSRFAAIAMILITALIISTFAQVNAAGTNAHESTSISTQNNASPEVRFESQRALTPSREKFQPQFIVSASIPNFSQPVRRPPIRRKGRAKH